MYPGVALCSYLEILLLFLIGVHWLYHLVLLSLVFSVSCHFKMLIISVFSPRFSFRNKSLSHLNTIDNNTSNNYHNAKCLKFWHSFFIRSSYKQIRYERGSRNSHSTVLETGKYKDCTLMTLVRTISSYKPKIRNERCRRHCGWSWEDIVGHVRETVML